MTFDEWKNKNFFSEEEYAANPMLERSRAAYTRLLENIEANIDDPRFVLTLSDDSLEVILDADQSYNFEILVGWINENITKKCYRYDVTTFMFADETDAILFEMVWG